MVFWLTLILIWLPITLFFPTRIIGKKNLIKGKSIWACTHQSNLDIMIISTKIFTRMYALGKSELFKNKLFGGYLKKLGCVPVKRGQVDLTAVKSCLKILKDKQKPLVIFPTGTRTSEPDEVENLKNGVVMFALKAKAPIVPMVLVRKAKFLRRNRLVVGEPIDITPFLDKKADKETYAEIIQILGHRMEELIERYSYKKKKTKHKNKEVQ